MRITRRTRFAIWFGAFAALALAAPFLPLGWGIALAIAVFAAGALLPAADCPVRPTEDARSR